MLLLCRKNVNINLRAEILMRRYTKYMNGEKYLGSNISKEVHDLVREKQQCRIDEIVFNEHERPFSTLDKAYIQGYSDCQYCIDYSKKSLNEIKVIYSIP